MNDLETPNAGPSRREFVLGAGAATLTGLASDALGAELQPAGNAAVPAVGPGATKITHIPPG